MQAIAGAIREGSSSFFRRVYGTIAALSLPVALLIFAVYYTRVATHEFSRLSPAGLALMTALSFLAGALCSCVAGFVGLWASVSFVGGG